MTQDLVTERRTQCGIYVRRFYRRVYLEPKVTPLYHYLIRSYKFPIHKMSFIVFHLVQLSFIL